MKRSRRIVDSTRVKKKSCSVPTDVCSLFTLPVELYGEIKKYMPEEGPIACWALTSKYFYTLLSTSATQSQLIDSAVKYLAKSKHLLGVYDVLGYAWSVPLEQWYNNCFRPMTFGQSWSLNHPVDSSPFLQYFQALCAHQYMKEMWMNHPEAMVVYAITTKGFSLCYGRNYWCYRLDTLSRDLWWFRFEQRRHSVPWTKHPRRRVLANVETHK